MWRTGTTVSLQGAKWEEGGRFLVPGDYTFVTTWDLRFPGRSVFIMETGEWGSKYFRNVLNFTFSTPEDSTMDAETLSSCFVVYFVTLPKTQSQTLAWMLIDDLGRIWKKLLLVVSRHYPDICLDGLRKTTKKVQNTKTYLNLTDDPPRNSKQSFQEKYSATFPLCTLFGLLLCPCTNTISRRQIEDTETKLYAFMKLALYWKNLLVSRCVRIAPYSVLIK